MCDKPWNDDLGEIADNEFPDEKDDEYGAIEDYKKGVNNHGAEADI